jgi:hypothetical protein
LNLPVAIKELRKQLARINASILAIEQLAGGGKRKGRPPKWIAEAAIETPAKRRGRPPGSGAKKNPGTAKGE